MDLLPEEPRPRRFAELALHVAARIEQHAMRRHTVAPGAARLLKKVFERAGDFGMDHEAHVRACTMPMPKAMVAAIARQGPAEEAPLHSRDLLSDGAARI